MILTDNLLILRNKFPAILELIRQHEETLKQQPVEITPAKNGQLTMVVRVGDQSHYVHSKYDPTNEAGKFADQFDEISPSQHVLFYGLGLGYHIQALHDKLGTTQFSIYEPNPAVFYQFLCTQSLKAFSFKNLSQIYLGASDGDMAQQLIHFVNQVKDPVLFVAHPAYRTMMKEDTERFMDFFKKIILDKRSALHVNVGYEKLWTINSANNFKKVLETPSILRDKKNYFQGKPVLLVAAGPSLNDEIENLRMIKEKGLAYIFAVGSANRALIKHNILPDAVTSYDPNTYNHIVFEEIIAQQIDSVPLVFGSSVGYETLNVYPGPKLHMITSQDSISSYYIGNDDLKAKHEIVSDAPSIAVVTLDMLAKLECSQVIFVGQNLGYRNNQYYSDGISYASRPTELREQEKAHLIEIESVDGEQMYSSDAHIRTKQQLEAMLANAPKHIEFINTTAGGAKIQGTVYMPLKDVIDQKLTVNVVMPDWFKPGRLHYDLPYMRSQAESLKSEFIQFQEIFDELLAIMRKLDSYASKNNEQQINRTLPRFDKGIKKALKNKYFDVFLRPLIRVQYELFEKSIPSVRNTIDPVKRVKVIIEVFGKFITECQSAHRQFSAPLFQKVNMDLEQMDDKYQSNLA
jgi:hypothetical protein